MQNPPGSSTVPFNDLILDYILPLRNHDATYVCVLDCWIGERCERADLSVATGLAKLPGAEVTCGLLLPMKKYTLFVSIGGLPFAKEGMGPAPREMRFYNPAIYD